MARSSRSTGGQPGNLNRKGGNARFITQALILELNADRTDPSDKKSKVKDKTVRWLVKKLVQLALDGDVTCLKMIMDRVEGMATQSVAFTMDDPNEAQRVEYTRDQLAKMPPEQQNAIYLSALREAHGVGGSA